MNTKDMNTKDIKIENVKKEQEYIGIMRDMFKKLAAIARRYHVLTEEGEDYDPSKDINQYAHRFNNIYLRGRESRNKMMIQAYDNAYKAGLKAVKKQQFLENIPIIKSITERIDNVIRKFKTEKYDGFAEKYYLNKNRVKRVMELLGIIDDDKSFIYDTTFHNNCVSVMVEDFSKISEGVITRSVYNVPIDAILCDDDEIIETCGKIKDNVTKIHEGTISIKKDENGNSIQNNLNN